MLSAADLEARRRAGDLARGTAKAGTEFGPSLSGVVQEHRGQSVALYPNRGNAGDGLVNTGARRFLIKNGVMPTPPTRGNAGSRPAVAFLVGAGGFSRPHHHNASLFIPLFSAYRRIYVLPASFDPDCEESNRFLRQLPPHVVVYCREAYSFRHARALSPYPGNVGLDHDMAFHFRYGRWMSVAGTGTLLAFRGDPECSMSRRACANLDLSRLGDQGSCWSFLEALSRFERVHTDRLHVAIAAAMMGKRVCLYPNTYWKNRGVYDYSLASRAGVEFVESDVPVVRGHRWWSLRYAWEVARRPPVPHVVTRLVLRFLRQASGRALHGNPRA